MRRKGATAYGAGGGTGSATITAGSGSWTAASNTNTGLGTVTYALVANGTGAQRVGNIVITGTNGATVNFVVTQNP